MSAQNLDTKLSEEELNRLIFGQSKHELQIKVILGLVRQRKQARLNRLFKVFAECVEKGKTTKEELAKVTSPCCYESINMKSWDIAMRLLKEGYANPNYRFSDQRVEEDPNAKKGQTILMMAVVKGDLDIIKTLLEYKADPNLFAQNGATALYIAVHEYTRVKHEAKNQEAKQAQKEKSSKKNDPLKAVKERFEIIKLLLAHHADPNVKVNGFNEILGPALGSEDLELIKLLLAHKVDANTVFSNGQTPLITALYSGNSAVIDMALAEKSFFSNINVVDHQEMTPLLVAISKANLQKRQVIIDTLLKAGADPNLGPTLFDAIEANNPTTVRQLLAQDNLRLGEMRGNRNDTPFFMAVRRGNIDIVKAFLDSKHRVDINQKDPAEHNATSLLIAIALNHLDIAHLLLDRGADPNVPNQANETPLIRAATKGFISLLERFLTSRQGGEVNEKNIHGTTPLVAAVQGGHIDCVKRLLEANADPDLSCQSNTPLMFAAQFENAEKSFKMVELLLTYKATIGIKNKTGATAFHYAAKGKSAHLDTLRLLLQAGAEVNARDNQGRTALFQSMMVGNATTLKFLLENKADPNIIFGKSHHHLLMVAVDKGYTHCLEILLDPKWKINVNAQDRQGMTALMQACLMKQEACIELLLKAKADPLVKTYNLFNDAYIVAIKSGEVKILAQLLATKALDINARYLNNFTLLHIAVQRSQYKVIQFLLENKADPNIPNERGGTPLMHAAFYGEDETIKMLAEKSKFPVNFEAVDKTLKLNALAQANNSKTVALLRSYGAKGVAFTCFNQLYLALLNDLGEDVLNRYIDAVDVTSNTYQEQAIEPFYLNANYSQKESRILVLKHKLYITKPTLSKLSIDSFIMQLGWVCDELSFEEMGTLSVSITIKNKQYTFSMTDDELASLIEHHKVLQDKPFKTGFGEKSQEKLKETLWLHTKEGRALKEKLDLNALKNNVLTALSVCHKHVSQGVTLLEHLKIETKKYDYKGYIEFDTLEASWTKHRQNADAKIEALEKENIFTKSVSEIKQFYSTIITFSEGLTKELNALHQKRNMMLEKHNNRMTKTGNTVSFKKKSGIANIVLTDADIVVSDILPVESTRELPLNDRSKDNVKEQVQALTNKRSKKKSKHKKKMKDNAVAHPSDIKSDAAKSNAAKSDVVKTEPVKSNTEATDKEGNKNVSSERETPSSVEFENKKVQELKRELDVLISHKPKKQAYLPKNIDIISNAATAMSFSKTQTRHGLHVPDFTMESATHLGTRLKAIDAQKVLNNVTQNISPMEGTLEYALKDYSESAKRVVDLWSMIECNAMKGALAHTLETRKDLGEGWPNHIRNILFRHEDFIHKHFDEEEIIYIIRKIQGNLEKHQESDLLHNKQRITLESADAEAFLKLLLDEKIPDKTNEDALRLIEKSKQELDLIQDFVRFRGPIVINDLNLRMAIGYSLTRLGTYSEMLIKSQGKGSKRSKNAYEDYVVMAREYRHNDPEWKAKIDAFMRFTLKISEPKPMLFQLPLHSSQPVSANGAVETKKIANQTLRS